MARHPRIDAGLAALCTLAAPGALAQATPAPGVGGGELVQVLLGLAAVLALLLGALHLMKRLSAPRGAASGLLRVVTAAAVGPREKVVLIEVGDTWLLVGVAPGRVAALHSLPRQALAPTPPGTVPEAGKDFGTWLNRFTEARRDAR